ncbi:dihydrofolate reductase family protein [Enterocloster lavalensis]|uniref:dihydrofolate reductase family protein n=1 Tax=Enterocloster lavalensis TaxID=460384 RepID=UPI001D08DC93|nr:dihydrofolate reductase family protein [Enterocloster lavalensis]
MKKPYIICHMMTSVDGRIDCAMTAQLRGGEDYYSVLQSLDLPTTVSGRVTAELELAQPGAFQAKSTEIYGQEGFSKKADAAGYEVVVDTKGKLLWPDATGMRKPFLIITSEQVTKEYLNYLDGQNISWIACGKDKIDLVRTSELLATAFHVERMGIVGGSAINTGFLVAGLLDEVSILMGAGVDGRGGFPPVFDGLDQNHGVTHLKLMDVKKFDSDAVWIRYKV